MFFGERMTPMLHVSAPCIQKWNYTSFYYHPWVFFSHYFLLLFYFEPKQILKIKICNLQINHSFNILFKINNCLNNIFFIKSKCIFFLFINETFYEITTIRNINSLHSFKRQLTNFCTVDFLPWRCIIVILDLNELLECQTHGLES